MLVNEIAEKYGCDCHTVTVGLRCCGCSGKTNAIARTKHRAQQLLEDGTVLNTVDSYTDAARYLIDNGVNGKVSSIVCNIGRVTSGKRQTASGYCWKDI